MNIKEDVMQYVTITADMVEKFVVTKFGGELVFGCNGADGKLLNEEDWKGYSKWMEVKSQIHTGNDNSTLLRGNGMYCWPSQELFDKKTKHGEWIYAVGCDCHFNMHYIFRFPFYVIQDLYKEQVRANRKKFSFYAHHYIHHEDTETLYISTKEILLSNKNIFQRKFFNQLLELSDKFHHIKPRYGLTTVEDTCNGLIEKIDNFLEGRTIQ